MLENIKNMRKQIDNSSPWAPNHSITRLRNKYHSRNALIFYANSKLVANRDEQQKTSEQDGRNLKG
jgi:hypothetical protein